MVSNSLSGEQALCTSLPEALHQMLTCFCRPHRAICMTQAASPYTLQWSMSPVFRQH